ncbi:MAG: 2-oxoacid:acceptor oxidoreductase family protein [Anaerolineae bacterium]|nr:2-oxoacid:acceptor oxidoreductase family protein [Anaerolineae bacterium]
MQTQTEIILAGFGGQGVLFAGMVLAYAGMDNGHNVSWLPSYGPEMRGGTANVTVIISDEEIGALVVKNPQVAVIFNNPSMEKFEPLVKPGGLLVYNSSLIDRSPQRTDITYLPIPANDIAQELGDVKMANMVAVGATVAATSILPLTKISQALKDHLPASKQSLLKGNNLALQRGAALAKAMAMA